MIRLHLPRLVPLVPHGAAPADILLLAVGLLAWGGLSGCADPPSQRDAIALEVVEEHWTDGGLHVRRAVMTTGDGRRLNHGPLSVWYETGEPRSEGHWHHGHKHGQFVFWHKNGQKAKEFTWSHGRGNGVFIAWDEQGNELRRESWRDGRRIEAEATTDAGADTQSPAAGVTPPHDLPS